MSPTQTLTPAVAQPPSPASRRPLYRTGEPGTDRWPRGLLLFDGYFHPGLAGIAVPFTLSYRPLFSGLGVVAAWLAAILGLSFYVRRRIGTRLWRRPGSATS